MDKLRVELERARRESPISPGISHEPSWPRIWNEMSDRAEFLFQDSRSPTRDRHVRPKILPPRPEKEQGQKASAGPRR